MAGYEENRSVAVASNGAATKPSGVKQQIKDFFATPPEWQNATKPYNGGYNPILKAYVHPGDYDWKRYLLLTWFGVTVFAWWLGPMCSLFIAEPLVGLAVQNSQVVTPRTDCFDYKEAFNECDDTGMRNKYYFYDITNVDKWIAGDEPPKYEERGPYTFKVYELRYNITFTQNWTQVGYTYHNFEEFLPNESCEGCSLSDTFTVINRGYQAYMHNMRGAAKAMFGAPATAAPASNSTDPPLPAWQMHLMFLPAIMSEVISKGLETAVNFAYTQGVPAGASAAADALSQWANCGLLKPVAVLGFIPTPFVGTSPTGFQFDPEYCWFVHNNTGEYGNGLDLTAAAVWMDAVIGNRTLNGTDPAATFFVNRFLSLSRTTHLKVLREGPIPVPILADALQPINETQWEMLQGYLLYLAGSYGATWYSEPFLRANLDSTVRPMVEAEKAKWGLIGGLFTTTPEKLIQFGLLPLAAMLIRDSLIGAVTAGTREALEGAGLNATQVDAYLPFYVKEAAMKQWAYCGAMNGSVMPVGPGFFPHAPELCAFIMNNASSIGITFRVEPFMFKDLGVELTASEAAAFLDAIIGTTVIGSIDQYAANVLIPGLMSAANWTSAKDLFLNDTRASLVNVTERAWPALQLWLMNLLPTWGKVVYSGMVAPSGADPGMNGLTVTQNVSTLLYGFADPTMAILDPEWRKRPIASGVVQAASFSFPSATYIADYLSREYNQTVTMTDLTYKTHMAGRYHNYVYHKLLSTGGAKGDFPQMILLQNGKPFGYLAQDQGIYNVSGFNEGIVQGPRFKADREPWHFETMLARPVKTISTGNHIRVRGVRAYQMTIHPETLNGCDEAMYETWKNSTAFDPIVFKTAMGDLEAMRKNATTADAYYKLVADDTALSLYLNQTELGFLGQYFAEDKAAPAKLARCVAPDQLSGAWDMTSTWATPTLYTLPRFYNADPAIINATGKADWHANFKQHGWYFSVEPVTGMTIYGHKPYMISTPVLKSDIMYPNLWTVEGSKDGKVGQALGLDDDFVIVPSSTLEIYWSPTKKAALALYGIDMAIRVMWWILMFGCPVFTGVVFPPLLYKLKFSAAAKRRKAELAVIHQSRAHKYQLSKHEQEMAEALAQRFLTGSKAGIALPACADDSDDDDEEGVPQAGGDKQAGGDAVAHVQTKSAAAAAAANQAGSSRADGDAFIISTSPQQHEQVAVTLACDRRSSAGGGTSQVGIARDGLRRRTTTGPEEP